MTLRLSLCVALLAAVSCRARRNDLHQITPTELLSEITTDVPRPAPALPDRVVENRRWAGPPRRIAAAQSSPRIRRSAPTNGRIQRVPWTGPSPAGQGASSAARCPDSPSRVVVFGASWCPACRAAKSWLSSRAVPFADRDVDSDRCAEQEMLRRLARAGMSGGSIPVIAVGERVFQGFSPSALQASGL